jgi:hypothetical protein
VGATRFARTLVVGVANDYLGYFVTAADYSAPGYVTCSTLYGPRTGECLAGAAGDLLTNLGRAEPTARASCDRG